MSEPRTMIGDRLGNWVIYKELGHGGMGRVYLAQEELTGRNGAVKVLAAALAQEAGFLHRFQREIDTLSTLDHPNIVRFYDSGFDNGLYFYAMEYVEGQSLEGVLEAEGQLPWKEVLDIALQICPALKHVHDHGIIHRDIKPPNILRSSSGHIKLADFGIAKVFASAHLTATGGVVGTAEYISPEQAAGKPVSKRSDIYSLGIVLYTLLTGRTPFEGESFIELAHKHRYGQFERPQRLVPEIPYEIDEVVCILLEKEPEKRPPDCLVLGSHLEKLRRRLERKNARTQAGTEKERTLVENASGPGLEEGPATLMSRLMRAELDRQNQAPLLLRLINRFWVLAPLLALCIGLIVWSLWPLDQDTLFARGAELMASARLAEMEQAWRDYLEPLERRFPAHPYREQLDQFRQQLEASRNPRPSEAQRFFQQGERLLQEGNAAGAEKIWTSLATVFKGVEGEKEWVSRAEKGVQNLHRAAVATERLQAVRPALERAAELRSQGKRAEAEAIWKGLETLYGQDPAGLDILREVQRSRQR